MRSIRIILILAGKQLRVLSRMPGILLVIFVPGIVMYSIFTKIFEGPAARPFKAAVVDLDQTRQSRKLIEALTQSNVKVILTDDEDPNGPPLTVESARRNIRKKGKFRVALVIPEGYGKAPDIRSGDRHQGVQLIYDQTQRIEADAIAGMVQMAAGRRLFSQMAEIGKKVTGSADGEGPSYLIKVDRVGVAPRRAQIASKHIFLAGIVPMFLLFGATGAARGMQEEMESGEIIRLRAAPIGAGHLIGGQTLSVVVTSMLQCYSMYLCAWLVFGVDIWARQFGLRLLALTLVTCFATTSFGMLLGAVCRSTQQLDSIGTVVILAMSAVGGSMVPRWIMPPFMQKMGLFTINGWSYDGFIGLTRDEWLWPARRDGVWEWGIFDECAVLLAIAAACLVIGSILLSRRLHAAPAA